MRRTFFEIPWTAAPLHYLALAILKCIGWKMEGPLPPVRKCVVILAPHTSNWDMPIATVFAFAYRVKATFLMKDAMFRWPFGGLFRLMGAIPVDRSRSQGLVDYAAGLFGERDVLMLGLTPEGTRKRVDSWKTGFYRIARKANVPISLAYLDYKRKVGGFSILVEPSGDVAADLRKIEEFYAGVTACHPELAGPPNIDPSTL